MRIVHGSDWHWEFETAIRSRWNGEYGAPAVLPEADLYVFTGDMMDNYPSLAHNYGWGAHGDDEGAIRPENERIRQGEAVKHFVKDGGFRRYLGSPDAPILCVRGNHDFIDLARLFEGCNLVHEFVDNEVVEVLGKRACGHRGIPYIYGTWNDEVAKPDLLDRVRAIPDDIDILLTHYPPSLVLDVETIGKYGVRAYGLEGMAGIVFNKLNGGGVHMFGHIHGSGGRTEVIDQGREFQLTFSNAAETYNVLEV
jgi:Icc-related predicted phosphoesterase